MVGKQYKLLCGICELFGENSLASVRFDLMGFLRLILDRPAPILSSRYIGIDVSDEYIILTQYPTEKTDVDECATIT